MGIFDQKSPGLESTQVGLQGAIQEDDQSSYYRLNTSSECWSPATRGSHLNKLKAYNIYGSDYAADRACSECTEATKMRHVNPLWTSQSLCCRIKKALQTPSFGIWLNKEII